MTFTTTLPRHRFVTSLLATVCAVGAVVGVAACGSEQAKDAPLDQGPNATTGDPGPNSTVRDPGPNPTDASVQTVSGTLSIVDGNCVRLVLDANQATLMLRFRDDYSVDERGLSLDETVVAAPKSRLFVTGDRTETEGQCGTIFNVESLNSAQNPG